MGIVLPISGAASRAGRQLGDSQSLDDPFAIAERMRTKSAGESAAADQRIKDLQALNEKLAKEQPLPGVNGQHGGRWPLASVPPVPVDPSETDKGGTAEQGIGGPNIGGIALEDVGSMGPDDEPAPTAARSDDQIRQRLQQLSDQRGAADMQAKVLSLDKTPDQAAQDQTLASTLGRSPLEVETDRTSAKASETAQRINRLTTDAPKLRAWLSEPENLAVSHDDTANLSWWEHAGNVARDALPNMGVAAWATLKQGAADSARFLSDITNDLVNAPLPMSFKDSFTPAEIASLQKTGRLPDKPHDPNSWLSMLSSAYAKQGRDSVAWEAKNTPEAKGAIEQTGQGVFKSIGSMASSIALAAGGKDPEASAETALRMMATQQGAIAYQDYREAGRDMATAALGGLATGAAEYGGELVPMHILFTPAKGLKGLIIKGLEHLGSDVPGEVATTAVEALTDQLEKNPDATFGDYVKSLKPAEAQTVLQTVFQSMLMVGGAKIIQTSHELANSQQLAAEAKGRSKIIEQMQTNAVDSKLLKRQPQKFQDFVTTATKDGPVENVSIPADKFAAYYNEAGQDPAAMAQSVGIAPETFSEALQSGQDLTIPTGAYATKLAAKDGGMDALGQHVRFAPDQMTAFEADTASKEFNAELQAHVEAYKQAAEGKATLDQSEQKVLDDITEKLKATGVYEKRGETIPANAAVMGAMASTLAKRVGMDPWEFWQQHGPEIRAQVAGETTGAEGALPQSRTPQAIDDATMLSASEKLTPSEFEAWKLATTEGLGNEDIAARMSDEAGRNATVEPPKISDKIAPATRRVLELKAEGRSNGEIAAQVFPDTDREVAKNRVKVLSSQHGQTVKALKRDAERTFDHHTVAVHLKRARDKGFEIERLHGGKEKAHETARVIALKAQGVSNKLIAERIYPDRSSEKAENLVKQLIFQHKDEIAAKREMALAQTGNRGEFLRRPGEQRSVIKLFETRNASTFMHESAHWYLDVLKQMGEQENAHPFVTQQLEAIAKWAGVATMPETFGADGLPTPEWREVQEKFAETFETYLESGKAPSVGLRKAFAAFKRWLVQLYRDIGRGGLTRASLSPEITDVMDRMLASEEEIDAAHHEIAANAQDLAEAMLKQGVIKSPAEYARVMARLADAKEQAEAELLAKLMDTYRREKKAEYMEEKRRTRAEVTREVDQRPEQRALAWLGRGQWMGESSKEADPASMAQASLPPYTDFNANQRSIEATLRQMKDDGLYPVLKLFKTTTGRLISFMEENNPDGLTHSQARAQLGLGHLKLKHGTIFMGQPLEGVDWHETTGSDPDTAPKAWEPNSFKQLREAPAGKMLKWYVDQVTEEPGVNANGEPVTNLWFKSTPTHPSGRARTRNDVRIEMMPVTRNGVSGFNVDMYYEGRLAAEEEPSPHAARVAQVVFAKTFGALKAYVDWHQPGFLVFAGSEQSQEKLYSYILRNLSIGGYEARIKHYRTSDFTARHTGEVDASDLSDTPVFYLVRPEISQAFNEDDHLGSETTLNYRGEPFVAKRYRFTEVIRPGSDVSTERSADSGRGGSGQPDVGGDAVQRRQSEESLAQPADSNWGPTVPPTNLPPMRLSLAATREQYGEAAVKALPASVIAHAVPEGVEHPEAIGPNEAAELLSAALGGGFQSGNVLLEALQKAKSRTRQIGAEVERRMLEKFPDAFKDGALDEKAAEYARNEAQYYQSELELEALARAVGLRPAKNAAKIEAHRRLSEMTVKQILGYKIFLTYERRATEAALKAATKGDALEAMLYKQRALINQVLFSEGAKLAEQIEKTQRFMLGFDKPSRQSRLLSAGQDYVDQMNALVEGYEFRPRTNKDIAQRQSLREWFAQKQAEADPLTVKDNTQTPEEALADQEEATARSRYLEALEDEAQVRHYTELSMDELDAVRANAGAIWTMAKTVDRLLMDQQRRSLKLAAEDIAASIIAEKPRALPKPSLESELPENKRKRSVGTYLAEHRTLQTLARQFDGGKDGGKFWNYIVRPLNEAFAHLSTLRSQASKDVAKLFKVYTQHEIAHLERGKMFIKAIDTTLTHQGRLAIALNAGNEKNLKRLMDSEGWSKEQVQAVIDTLDKRDMDFVQSVFAYVDTFFADANAVHERVHGFPMTKEAAMPIQTRHGTYAGGYYPIQFDSARSAVTEQRALVADGKAMGGRVGTRTEIGSAKKRVEGKVTIPLKLSVFDVITRHVDQVITSIATEKALLDVGRLVVRPEVKEAVISRYGLTRYNAILSSLRETKNGQEVVRKARDRILVHLRNGQTIVGLGLNLHTAMLQPLGLSNSVVRVGGYWMTKGILRAGATAVDRLRGVNFIKQRSEFMRNRELAQNRELADLRADIRPGLVPPWVARGMMVHIMKTQYLAVDVPTWFGQYEKSIAAQWSDEDASAHADQAVIDAQGSGETHALADVQRGSPIWKLFTNFMSFFLTVYNLSAQRIGNTNFKNAGQVAHLAADMALLWSFPVAAQYFMDKWLLSGGPDDDPWAEYLKQQLAFLMGPFAILNQLAGGVQGYDYRGPQGLTALADATKAIPQVGKAIDDARQGELQTAADDLTDKNFWRPANRAAGAIFHYPAGQIDRTVRGLQQLQSGETDDLAVILFGPKRAPKN